MKQKLLTLLTLLLIGISSAWGEESATNNPATVSYGTGTASKTFLNVANTVSNATIKDGSVACVTYGLYEMDKNWKPAFYSGPANGNSSSYNYDKAADFGFLAGSSAGTGTTANKSATSGYGAAKYTSTATATLFVTGITGVAVMGKDADTKNNKYLTIQIQEYAEDGTLTAVGSTNSSLNKSLHITEYDASATGNNALSGNKYYKITLTSGNTSNCETSQIRFTKYTAPTGLSIKTQPVSAGYVSGAAATALTVEAQGGTSPYSYQWYSSTDAVKTSTTALTSAAEIAKGSQSASYTPSTTATGYYYCKVTDNASPTPAEVESNVATITISAATAPTISIESDADAAVDKGTVVTLTATATGVPTPTIQWYQNTVNNSTTGTPIAGATETTYQPSTTAGGTLYYYAIATNNYNDADHSATSNVVAVEVNRSNACVLNQVVYSNSFDAFITAPSAESNGKIKAYYLAGTAVPTITSVNMSDGATYSLVGTTFTVTAEDETTTAVYDVTVEAVEPYTGSGITFDGTETWVKNGGGFKNETGNTNKEGYIFSKTDNDWNRETPGKTRIYFFLAPSASVKLVGGLSGANVAARPVKTYVNGGSEKSTSIPLNSADPNYITVTGDENSAYMLAVVSNQSSGDGAIKSIEITPATDGATISASGYNTFSSSKPLDLSSITNGTAYVATGVTDGKVVLSKSTAIVPAGTGLFIAGTESEEFTVNACYATPTLEGTNLFVGAPSGTTVEKAGDGEYNYVFGWTDAENPGFYLINGTAANLGAGKAYLHTTSALSVDTSARGGFIFEDEGETTGVVSVGKPQTAGNREVYNLNGQRVAQPAKGLYIVNGKKVIIK